MTQQNNFKWRIKEEAILTELLSSVFTERWYPILSVSTVMTHTPFSAYKGGDRERTETEFGKSFGGSERWRRFRKFAIHFGFSPLAVTALGILRGFCELQDANISQAHVQ